MMKLDEKQKAVVRWFQKNRSEPIHTYEAIVSANHLTDSEYESLIQYLWRIEAVAVESRDGDPLGAVCLGPKFRQLIYDLDNLPPPDAWERWATWIRWMPWSFPILVILVGIPLVYTWIQIFLWMERAF